MIAATFLLLAAQALPAPGSITGWEALPEDPSGFNSIAPASIRRDGDITYVLVRGIPRGELAEGYRTVIMRFRVDCRARTFGIEAADAYGEDGRLIATREVAPAEVAMVPPGNLASFVQLVDRACRR